MILRLIKIFCLCLIIVSCGEQEQSSPQEPLKLVKSSYFKLKGWSQDNLADFRPAFINSCQKIITSKSEFLGNSVIKIPTSAYAEICNKFLNTPKQDIKNFIRQNFVPYLVTYNQSPKGKFTSYYEAAIRASFTPDDTYRYPIYGRPHDIIEFNPHDFDAKLPNQRFVGRIKDKKLVPYYTRTEIESNGIDAPVILWADNYIDIYIMQIQGSAVATLPDGSKIRIGYADNNGQTFKGIGSILLENNLLEAGKASMLNIKKWLQNNLDVSHSYMQQNHRYIFHRLIEASGPIGAQGLPLTAGRSLAVDKHYLPLGSLLWLETTYPNQTPLNKMVIAQDIGSAIKGAVRGDYFWGSGGDDILELSGKMNSTGQYYILLPKNVEID